jgi:hypothetical protein
MAWAPASTDHGKVSASLLRPTSGGSDLLSPPALRARRPSWRDPRLAVGLLLVFVSVLVGARVLATSDDTVAVLAARDTLVAGQRITAADLTEVRLRFTSDQDADRYLSSDQPLPDGAVLLRPVGPGELVPRTAVSTDAEGLVELPLAVDPGRVPASVRAGSLVDVWVTPGDAPLGEPEGAAAGGADSGDGTERLLGAVPVLSVSRTSGLGSGGLKQVVVGVPAAEEGAVRRVVAKLQGSLLLVRRPG